MMNPKPEFESQVHQWLAEAVQPENPHFSPELAEQLLQSTVAAPFTAAQLSGILAKSGLAASKWLIAKKIALGLGMASAAALGLYWLGKPKPVPDGLERYKLAIPSPAYASSPIPMLEVPNFDPAAPIATFFDAPPGLQNRAHSARVTSSDGCPLHGALFLVCDGQKSMPFADHGLELGAGPQWICLDLGRPLNLHTVVVWHRFDLPVAYEDVLVEISSDPGFPPSLTKIIFNNDHDNSLGRGVGTDRVYLETNCGRIIPAGNTPARYLRLWSNGRFMDGMNHYTEVEAWGK